MSEREEPVSVSPEKPPAREDNSGGAIGRRTFLATARPVACCVALSGVMKSKGNAVFSSRPNETGSLPSGNPLTGLSYLLYPRVEGG